MRRQRTGLNQCAFTIVELMIATSVLSTIILLVTVMMISIGNLFYKGISQSRTQDAVRTITDQVSQDLKLNNSFNSQTYSFFFNGKTINEVAYCIGGSVRYSAVTSYNKIGNQPQKDTDGSTPFLYHVLWRDSPDYTGNLLGTASDTCRAVDLHVNNLNDSTGTELIPPNSRLTGFTITHPSPSVYDVSVGAAYGDIDLLNLSGLTTTCKGVTGDQFCATANLTTTVTQRIPSGS